jgi:hypothetical protein
VPGRIRPTASVQRPCRPPSYGSPRSEAWLAWLGPWPRRRPRRPDDAARHGFREITVHGTLAVARLPVFSRVMRRDPVGGSSMSMARGRHRAERRGRNAPVQRGDDEAMRTGQRDGIQRCCGSRGGWLQLR